MDNIPKDVVANVSDEDVKTIQSEMGDSGKEPEVDSSPTKQIVEKASSEADNASVQEPVKEPEKASEGDKTLSTKVVSPKVRQTSQTVPYERFKEVNDKLKEALKGQPEDHSNSISQQGLDEYGRPDYTQEGFDKAIDKAVTKRVQDILEPVVSTLDKQMDDAEFKKALESHPEAEKFEEEIKAYASATNLTYDDIVALVVAKHSKSASREEVKQAEIEAQEVELSGKSNSAAKRKSPSMADVKNLSLEELEKLVDQQE